jgi:hypothetical protein
MTLKEVTQCCMVNTVSQELDRVDLQTILLKDGKKLSEVVVMFF